MTKECTTPAPLDSTIAERLIAQGWWDTLDPTDQNIITLGTAAPSDGRDRIGELARRLRTVGLQNRDPLGIRDLIRQIDGTKCQESLLREAIREIGRILRSAPAATEGELVA